MEKQRKTEIINQFQKHKLDTGSMSVQIAVVTNRINELSLHFKVNPKDFGSQRGMMKLISRRRAYLQYVAKKSPTQYTELIKALGLRK